MDTSDALEKLRRRKKNMESEISLLTMNSICGLRSPSQACDDKEHIFNAEKELELINLAISKLESANKNTTEEPVLNEHTESTNKEIKEVVKDSSNISPNMENSSNNSDHYIKESTVKNIGTGVFIGVLILMVAYIFRTQFGIPL